MRVGLGDTLPPNEERMVDTLEVIDAEVTNIPERLPAESSLIPLASEAVREEHGSIAERFLRKVKIMMESDTAKIESYGVDLSWREIETLALRIDEKTLLKIVVEKSK